MTLQALKIVER